MSPVETSVQRAKQWNPLDVNPGALFHSPDLNLLCAEKTEGQYYERKSKRDPEDLAKTICAFANSNRDHGGLLAVGISDDGHIEGLYNRNDINVNRLLEYHHYTGAQSQHKLFPCVNTNGQNDKILLIYVPYLKDRVAETSKGRAYVREGDETRELRDSERRELEYTKGQISFEDETVCVYADDVIEKEIFEELKRSVATTDGACADVGVEQLLLSRHLAKRKNGELHLAKAGLLILGKDPKAHLPGAYVRFVRYQGTEKKTGHSDNVVKDEIFTGPLPRLVHRLIDFLRSQLREFTFMGPEGKFLKESEYPEFAWQEAMVNALVHRSYSQVNTPIFMDMYDDRLEIKSPGDYPAGVHPREFIHNPRNPHLMDAMRYLRFVRMLSEGSLRMRHEMERLNLPPPEFSQPGKPYVLVVLRNDIERRLKERIGEAERATAFTNLFRITWQPVSEGQPASEEEARVPEFREIKAAILSGLTAQGYAVDSFVRDTAIDIKNEQAIPELKKSGLATIYPGFRFQIVELQDGMYLLVDHTIEVKNRARLDRVLALVPAMRSRRFGKAFVRRDERWLPCRIREMHANDDVSVEFLSEETGVQRVNAKDVLPDLPTTWIAELLEKAGVNFDLNKTTKALSLLLSRNAPRERSRKVSQIAKHLSERLFPLRIRGYRLYLDASARRLKGPGVTLGSDLADPEPIFSKELEGRARTVIDGLSTYGSYEKPQREVPLVLLCTKNSQEAMGSLVAMLRQGSAKFRGMEKTFAVSFGDPIVAAVGSPTEYLAKCRQICASIPQESFFLVYCPEIGFSRADYKAPYYQVKHFLLEAGFPSQMVDEETLRDPRWKDFNLALDIFAKAGHVPWVLSEGLPDADLFLGLSYSSIQAPGGMRRLIGYVNVFDRYGKWLYYRGNTEAINFNERDRVFADLLRGVAQEYQQKAKLQRLHVHHGFKLSHESRQEIASGVKAIASGAEVSFVHINKHSLWRLYDDDPKGDGTLRRGAYVTVAPNRFFISTTGQNDLRQKGMGTPRPLEVQINRVHSKGELDARIYAQHVLSLTKLNWASTKDFCREPITLKFASDIAYLMNVFLVSFGSFKLHPRLERTPWFL
jgi:predicted HTH transcriptional regulator